jgi:hypothetical protein
VDTLLVVAIAVGALAIIGLHFLWIKPRLARSGTLPGALIWPRIIAAYAVLIGGVGIGMLIWPSGDSSRYQFGALSALIGLGIAGTTRRSDTD